uniref:G-protein coupled receptors family 1 profile domain-containing protein n=1 Tax=Sinocyclocheilus grahami TaxID=75366 RepID=A0A672NJ70_SINGR
MNQTDFTRGVDYQCHFNETVRNSTRVSSLVFYYLTLILGVPGNAFVVYVAGLKMKRTVNTVGFLNLAIADLLCCLSTLYYLAQRSHLDHCPYGSIMCKILHFIVLITMFASVFTLSLISLDRFTLVITPVWAQNHRSLFIARLSCAAAWILASVLSLPFMMLRKTYTENNKTYCLHFQHDEDNFKLYRRLSIIRFVFGFLVPLVCITTCYGFIARKKTYTENNKTYCLHFQHDEDHFKLETYTENNKTLSIIRFVFGFLVPLVCITTCYGFIARKLGRSHFHSGRAFRIMLSVIVAFFLCWLPYHIVDLMIMYGEESSSLVALAVDPLAISLAYFNSCLNPVLDVFMGQDFKSNVKLSPRRVFERVFSEEGTQISQTTHSQQMHSL